MCASPVEKPNVIDSSDAARSDASLFVFGEEGLDKDYFAGILHKNSPNAGGPLVELAPRLSASLKPGGSLVLSGILEEQADEVESTYASNFTNLRKNVMDGWVLLTGTK